MFVPGRMWELLMPSAQCVKRKEQPMYIGGGVLGTILVVLLIIFLA